MLGKVTIIYLLTYLRNNGEGDPSHGRWLLQGKVAVGTTSYFSVTAFVIAGNRIHLLVEADSGF